MIPFFALAGRVKLPASAGTRPPEDLIRDISDV